MLTAMGPSVVTVNLKMGCAMMLGVEKMVLSHLLMPKTQASAHRSMWIADHLILILFFALVPEIQRRDGDEKGFAVSLWVRCYF